MTDYVEKIRNLLEMAERETTNEHEARTALLKARELMAKHKIAITEISHEKELEVVRKLTGIDYSTRRDPWISNLANTIASYHCCKSFQHRKKGKQIAEIGFFGFADDISICIEIFKYAVDCVRSQTKKLRKTNINTANNYGFGFVTGLQEAYNKQEKGWELVLTVPDAVNKATNGLKRGKSKTIQVNIDTSAYVKGISDGHKFHEQKRIK